MFEELYDSITMFDSFILVIYQRFCLYVIHQLEKRHLFFIE